MLTAENLHTPECLARQASSLLAQQAFDTRFPNYCHTCNGTGLRIVSGGFVPMPFGAGNCQLPDEYEGCGGCVESSEHGVCPRCRQCLSERDDKDGYSTWLCCGRCGWDMSDGWRFERPHAFEPRVYSVYEDADACSCPGFVAAVDAVMREEDEQYEKQEREYWENFDAQHDPSNEEYIQTLRQTEGDKT